MKVSVEKHEDGTYWGTVTEVPGVVTSFGATLAELKINLEQAYADYYALAVELEEEYVHELEAKPDFVYLLNLKNIFQLLPEVKVSNIAKKANINPSLLRQYKTGKNAGDDFADQKITLPTILAWQDGDAEERAFWQRTLGGADFAEGDLERAQALLASHDAVNRSVAVAHDHAVKACTALTPFIGDERTATLARALADAALFAAHRAS